MDNEPVAAVLRLVDQHVGALEPIRMLFARLLEIERHTLAAMLGVLVVGMPLARHGDQYAFTRSPLPVWSARARRTNGSMISSGARRVWGSSPG